MAFTSGNDFNILQNTDLDNVDAGAGDDVYIVTAATLEDGKSIQIVDHQGNNTLQLVGGLEIESSIVAANTLALTLTNGSVITLTNASSFGFEPGGNITAGIDNEDVDYTTFATTTLSVEAIPEEGITEGGAVTIEGGSTVPNEAPTAEADTATTDVDTAVQIAVLENDSDPEDDSLTIIDASQGDNGATVEIVDLDDGTQGLSYTPAEGFEGADTITYTIDDGNGNEVTGEVTVEVGTIVPNEAPTAEADAATTDVDTAVQIVVLENDSDPEGDSLTIIDASQGDNGATVEIVDLDDGTQGLSYTPAEGFEGTDTITYTIDDGNGNEVTGDVTIEVGTVVPNAAPTAEADAATTDVDTAVQIVVLENDSDPEGDSLTIIDASQGDNGATVEIVDLDDGTQGLSYTPAEGFEGTDTITYTIDDGNGNEVTGDVTIEVGTVVPNAAPTAVADDASTEMNTAVTVDVLANDSDPEEDTLTITAVTAGANGTAVITDAQEVEYTPTADFVGTDTITYTINDGNGNEATAEVTVEVIAPVVPTYAITPPAAAVEGAATPVIFNVATTNVANGTLAYTIGGTGIETADIVGGVLTGSTTVTDGAATITVVLADDAVVETDTLVVTLDADPTKTATVNVVDTSPSGPKVENVSAANDAATPFDAAAGAFDFVFAASPSGVDYTYNITGFGLDDVLDLPDAFFATATVPNTKGGDGNMTIMGNNGANVITIELTGIEPTLDTAFSVASFNAETAFGAGSLI